MFRFRLDWWLILPSLLLLTLGVIVLRSVAPELVFNQALFIFVSICFFLIFSITDFQIPSAFSLPLYVGSLIFLVTPYLFGLSSRGAIRWLQIGQFTLQPSEVVKPFLLITFAILTATKKSNLTVWLIISFILPWLLIFYQPDLGTSLVVGVGWLVVFLSRLSFKTIFVSGLGLLLLLIPVYRFALKTYQKDRLLTFVDPYMDPLDKGYHVIQSMIAVGSGEILGRGLGHGTQSQLRFLPERHTDFVFASLSEELGFVGGLFVIGLFLIIMWRIYDVSQSTNSPAAALFCLAVMVMLAFQTFINIGMNMGLAPITGITLPFLSYGGSSLLSLGITLGLVNSISGANRPNSL